MRVCVVNKDLTDIINSRQRNTMHLRQLVSGNTSSKDSPYSKGIKYYYSIDNIETLNGSQRQRTYFIYRMETQEYLFGLDEKEFHKYFVDLEDYREDTINDLLK